jgi:hypothetical protein
MKRRLVLIVISVLSQAVVSWGEELEHQFVVKSQYFSVYGPPQLNVLDVLNKMDYSYFLHADVLLDKKDNDPKVVLGKTLDSILLESSRILGINIFSFEANLEFLEDENTVKVVIKNLVGVDVNERAFYLHDLKTVYISIQDLTVGMLGHEIAHAVISHYFGAPPAENIQEILAGYVDYSLTKSTQTLQ